MNHILKQRALRVKGRGFACDTQLVWSGEWGRFRARNLPSAH